MVESLVYLIHLDTPLAHARHYLGTTEELHERVKQHLATTWKRYDEPQIGDDGRRHLGEATGSGATFLGAVNAAGIQWKVVRTWKGGRKEERALKRANHNPRFCPICNPAHWSTRGKEIKVRLHSHGSSILPGGSDDG